MSFINLLNITRAIGYHFQSVITIAPGQSLNKVKMHEIQTKQNKTKNTMCCTAI